MNKQGKHPRAKCHLTKEMQSYWASVMVNKVTQQFHMNLEFRCILHIALASVGATPLLSHPAASWLLPMQLELPPCPWRQQAEQPANSSNHKPVKGRSGRRTTLRRTAGQAGQVK